MALKIDRFENLRTDNHIDHPLRGIESNGKTLTLVLRHLSDDIPGWKSARARVAQLRTATDAEWAKAMSPYLAKLAVVGWKNAFDEQGKPETYSVKACEKLLLEIVDAGGPDLISEAITRAITADNFRMQPALDAGDLGNA